MSYHKYVQDLLNYQYVQGDLEELELFFPIAG